MAVAMLMSMYGTFVGLMLYVFYLGAKSALFGQGYWLVGGRESFGWGARVAGALLMSPVLISIIYWIAVLASGSVTTEELGRGERWLGSFLTAGLSVTLGIAASYILAEVTYTPYWVLTREDDEDESDFDQLSEKEKKKRLKKVEMKREKRRLREEQKRMEREAEDQRLRERLEAKARKGPPPIPDDDDYDDDDDYRHRRRD